MISLMTPSELKEPEWIFPFQGMEIGDSFFIPTLRFAEMMYAVDSGSKRDKTRVKCYVSVKDSHLGVRVWRVG
jgi:hypothetical protein